MDDDIQLPTPPRANLSWNQDQVERYARACYEAGLAAGRAWIDSERNRELARRLRDTAELGYTAPTDEVLRDAADALDGGGR